MVDSNGRVVTRLPHRLARAGLERLQQRWHKQAVRDRTVLFESFAGASFACNPLALYRGMLADPAFAAYEFVWAVDDTVLARTARPEVGADHRVDFVRRRSRAYFKTLATARYLVNNVTFPVSFAKRPDQVYLNTWHGTPLKKMGRDVAGIDAVVLADTESNLRQADFVLSQSPYMTDVMYRGAYGLPRTERILELGYPRVDAQFDQRQRSNAVEQLAAAGLGAAGRRVVLYAPTWRQASDTEAVDDTATMAAVMRGLRAAAPEAAVLLRVHDKALPFVTAAPELRDCLAPTTVATNVLLGLADTLITDYSSVFFDFLATGSEVLFYAPDRADYDRGLYLCDDELPGPVTGVLDELLTWVSDGAPRGGWTDAEVARRRFCPDDDGAATGRVLAAVFGE